MILSFISRDQSLLLLLTATVKALLVGKLARTVSPLTTAQTFVKLRRMTPISDMARRATSYTLRLRAEKRIIQNEEASGVRWPPQYEQAIVVDKGICCLDHLIMSPQRLG